MPRYGIAIDTENCMACYNCFMSCKDEHCGFATTVSAPQPHTGHSWIRVESEERGDDSRRIKTSNVAIACLHCHDAACMKASQNGAVYRRPDGIVIIDPERAKGQRGIASACPIDAIFWNEELDIPQKCTMCAHLLDEGYVMPRCVEACPNEAMYFGDLDDPDSEISKVIREGRISRLKELGDTETNVVHLNIPTVFAAGSVYLPDDEVADGALIRLTNLSNGQISTTSTNYFGDWEFEWLVKGDSYSLEIEYEDYLSVSFEFTADTNHYTGEVILDR